VGLFANRSIAAGETIMLEPPVLIVMRDALDKLSREGRHAFQNRGIGQLPAKTRQLFLDLAKSRGGDVLDDIFQTNAMGQSYTGSDGKEVGHLAVIPEAAVSKATADATLTHKGNLENKSCLSSEVR
jgi:hypothetical protein